MKHVVVGTCLALGLALPAYADVTLKQTTGGKGLGMSGSASGVIYIRGNKMRTDVVVKDKTNTMIFDVDAQRLYIFDSKKKEADVWDMGAFTQEMSKSVAVGEVSASMKPNGQTKSIAGQNADGYDVNIVVPATMGGPGGMQITMLLTGTSWIAKGAPGSADYSAFYQGAAEKGWIFSDPRAAQGSPGQAKAMAQMYAEFAKIGGIPYETQMDIKAQGEGPMAALMSRMGSVETTTTTDSVETGPLADELFQVPADYKLKQRQ